MLTRLSKFKIILFFTFALIFSQNLYSATYTIANGDVAGLRNAINAANNSREDDIIILATNGIYDITSAFAIADDYGTPDGGIAFPMLEARDFSGSLTIRGNGATIRRAASATGKFRFFFCRNNVTLLVENLTLREADAATNGAVFYLGYNAINTFRNVKFINNKTSAGFAGAVFSKSLGTNVFENCEFTGNNSSEIGGAIYNVLSDLSVSNSTFTGNFCANPIAREGGGAIYTDGARGDTGRISLIGCNFVNNQSYAQGGAVGLFVYNRNVITIDKCNFTSNEVRVSNRVGFGFGGGIWSAETKIGNVGGGYTDASVVATTMTISNSTISKNNAHDQGGGIWVDNKTVNISNTTIEGNTVDDGTGGGIKVSGAGVNFDNCTIANNFVTDGMAGGIDNFGGRVSLKNTIFLDNKINNGNRALNFAVLSHYRTMNGGTLSDLGNNIQFLTGDSRDTALPNTVRKINPQLFPIADNGGATQTMALQAGSPAIDAGNNCAATDQRGIARVGTCDIGAFEFVPLCGTTTLTAGTGTLSDGSGANDYTPNLTCTWLIQPAGAGTIRLNFSAFATESGYDFVEVYNGANASAPLLGRYSGTAIPPTINASGNVMFIRFTTDRGVNAQGWDANYSLIAPSLCGTTTLTASTGSITDGSGANDYLNFQNCTWLIQPAGSGTIRLNFTAFATESGYDFVEIYDGTNASAQLLGRYSGTAIPPTINATGNVMFIRFTTDRGVTAQGWDANYSLIAPSVCGTTTLTASTGTLSDGSGANDYLNFQNCTWLIQPAGSGTIRLNFTAFATESGYDFVEVYDGANASAPLLGRYSGTAIPPTINATGNVMFIRFTTDRGVTAQGWAANYSLIAPVFRAENEENVLSESLVNVYPNPVIDELNIQIQSNYTGKMQIQVYNTIGVVLSQNEISKDNPVHKLNIDMNTYAPGAYFVRIIQGENQIVKKVIK